MGSAVSASHLSSYRQQVRRKSAGPKTDPNFNQGLATFLFGLRQVIEPLSLQVSSSVK